MNRLGLLIRIVLAVACVSLEAAPSLAKSRVERGLEMPSATLGRPIHYDLYIPSQPRRSRGARLPVLYLLHGHGDDENAWLKNGRIRKTLDKLIAARRIPPLMVVMPMAGNSWYVDDARKEGYGPVAQAMTGDFIKGIDQRYRTDACRERRAIGGLSMGGYGAILYATMHPEMFAAAISLSGSLFTPNLGDDPDRRRRMSQIFAGVFGQPFDMKRFNDWNVFRRIDRLKHAKHPPKVWPEIWLEAGDEDFPAILEGTVALHLTLRRLGFDSQLRVTDAGHTWRNWSKAIVPALKWLGRHISKPCAEVTKPAVSATNR